MEIIISGEDKKLLRQVENLAKKLGLSISKRKTLQEEKKKKAIKALENLTKINAFKEIEDPVAWQRNLRKDRNIGRDE